MGIALHPTLKGRIALTKIVQANEVRLGGAILGRIRVCERRNSGNMTICQQLTGRLNIKSLERPVVMVKPQYVWLTKANSYMDDVNVISNIVWNVE